MKVFVSSVMNGFEALREAAFEAIRMLGHEVVSAESFPSTTASSRVACLDGVRRADLVVLILGGTYGWSGTASGLSPTHEEYLEARDQGKVLAFVQAGVEREPSQATFVEEVQNWDGGVFRGREFSTPEELRALIVQALHQRALAQAARPVNVDELLAIAEGLIPRPQRGFVRNVGTLLHLAVVGGPTQPILRPTQLEDPALMRWFFGQLTQHDAGYFDYRQGTDDRIDGSALRLVQPSGAAFRLDESGALLLGVPVQPGDGMLGGLIEENVKAALDRCLGFANLALAHVDPTEKLSRLVIAAELETAGVSPWRTMAEHRRSPNSGTIGTQRDGAENRPVRLQPPDRPRGAIRSDQGRLAEDLLTLLRRKFRT